MFGTPPKGGQAKLRVGVEKGFSENALLWVEELANEGIVEPGLPFLDEGHFKTAIICPVCIDWDWSPHVQVVMILPIAKCQISVDKSFFGELKVLSGSAVLSVEGAMHGGSHINLGCKLVM